MAEVNEYLEHYGIRGMKWGVRRDPKTGIRPIAQTLNDGAVGRASQRNVDRHDARVANRKAKKLAKADKKWETNINTVPTYIAVHNRAADLANNFDIDRINNMPKFKDRDMNNMDDPVTKEYFKAHERAFNKRMKQAAEEIIGTNPSGTKKIHIDLRTGETTLVDVVHMEGLGPTGKIVAEFDELHHITRFVVVPDGTLSQSEIDVVEAHLEHYGIKGMKWGVRKRSSSRSGGRTTYKKKPARLSDAELSRRIKRMELEKKYNDLNSPTKSAGAKYATSLLENSGRTATAGLVGTATAFFVGRFLKQKFGSN